MGESLFLPACIAGKSDGLMVSKERRQKKVAVLLRNEWSLSLVIVLITTIMIFPHLQAYAWNYDEGPVLLAAKLGQSGYSLYDEIVYNKPPLLVWYLRLAFIVGGATLPVARLAVLLLNAAGLLALGGLAQRWWGRWAGLATICLFLLVPETAVRLPVVMNDLPAMSCAAITLLAASYYREDGRAGWLLGTGISFALTLGFHPLYLILAFPLFLMIAYPAHGQRISWTRAARALLVCAAAVAAGIAAWLLPVIGEGFKQWVFAYNRAPLSGAVLVQAQKNGQTLWGYLLVKQGYFTLLLLSSSPLLWRRRSNRFWVGIALLWLYLIALSLFLLRPLWPHYLLLALQPVLVIGGGGLAAAVARLKTAYRQRKWPVPAIVTLSIGLLITFHGVRSSRQFPQWTAELTAVQQILAAQRPEQFLLSDNQFLLFTSGHLTPPELTDTSNKREATGFITAADIINAYWAYRPAFILFENIRLDALPPVRSWAEQLAITSYSWDDIFLYQLPLPPQTPQVKAAYSLEPDIAFTGFTLSTENPSAGTELAVNLFWQARAPLPDDYHLFLHLLGENGELAAQLDTRPGGEYFPTSAWAPGVRVVEQLRLTLPESVSPGTYRLAAGMYTFADVQRLPVFAPDGQPMPADMIPLGEVAISARE